MREHARNPEATVPDLPALFYPDPNCGFGFAGGSNAARVTWGGYFGG